MGSKHSWAGPVACLCPSLSTATGSGSAPDKSPSHFSNNPISQIGKLSLGMDTGLPTTLLCWWTLLLHRPACLPTTGLPEPGWSHEAGVKEGTQATSVVLATASPSMRPRGPHQLPLPRAGEPGSQDTAHSSPLPSPSPPSCVNVCLSPLWTVTHGPGSQSWSPAGSAHPSTQLCPWHGGHNPRSPLLCGVSIPRPLDGETWGSQEPCLHRVSQGLQPCLGARMPALQAVPGPPSAPLLLPLEAIVK